MRRSNRYWTLAWVGIAASSVAGCEEDIPGSNVVDTDEIYAEIEIVGREDRTEVGVLLRQDGPEGLALSLVPGDALVASKGGKKTKTFTKDAEGRYHGALNGSETGAEVVVGFERDEADSALASKGVLPEAFSLNLDMESTELARGNNVPVAWDPGPAATEITWRVNGSCIQSASGTTRDDGQNAIGTQQIKVGSDSRGATCDVEISLERVAEGVIDSKFGKGGKVSVAQRRTVVYTSTPGVGEE